MVKVTGETLQLMIFLSWFHVLQEVNHLCIVYGGSIYFSSLGGLVPNLEFSRENVKNICKNKYNFKSV